MESSLSMLPTTSNTKAKKRIMTNIFIEIIIDFKMKRNSSSKKKKYNFIDQRSGQETATPRCRKSHSMTNTNYLQLQLDTSSKKKQSMEKVLQIKDKRIKDLEKEVKEHQQYMINSTVKYRQIKSKCDHQKNKNQRLQHQLKQAVTLCKAMQQKCKQLVDRNQNIERSEQLLRERLQFEQKKFKQLKELRKRQKQELKQLILPLLQSYANKTNLTVQDIEKVNKML